MGRTFGARTLGSFDDALAFGFLSRVGFREESVVRRDARAFDDGIARLAVKINRHL